MELSVSNEFLSLFIPEQSQFKMEDIINEFKIYIFKIMGIPIEELVQEQINNEYNNTELKSKYKNYFSDKIPSVMKVNDLYNEILNKTSLIKNSLEENMKNIEINKVKFSDEKYSKEQEKLIKEIQINKNLLKNKAYLYLLNIPSLMIECIQNEEYDLYLEYYNYVKNIKNDTSILIKNIKGIVNYIHKNITELFKDILSINYKELKLEQEIIFDLLNIDYNIDIFGKEQGDIVFMKQISSLFFQINLYMKLPSNSFKYTNLLSFFEEKILLLISFLKPDLDNDSFEKRSIIKAIRFIYEKYLIDIFNRIFNEEKEYNEAKNKIINFTINTKLFDYSPNILNDIDTLMKNYFFKNLNKLLKDNETAINNFLIVTKDIKKFFGATIQITNNTNKNIVSLKYEILFILYNNLAYINNFVVSENFLRFKDKVETIELIKKHIENIISIFNNFFNDAFFSFKITSNNEIEKEFNNFLEIFKNSIIIKSINDFFLFFQMPAASILVIEDIENKINNLNNWSFI